jgi:pSer/pThr/pTyr-binding forkhead associated (FHA) protein
MAIAASTSPAGAQAATEAFERHGVLGHSARRESLAFVRPAPGRYLAIEDGELTRLVALHQPVTHVGRGFSADLRLEDQSVSRRHAVIVEAGDDVRILDDRSANGTFVNDRRVTDAVLHDRDVVRLGRVVLVYREVPGCAAASPR